MSAEWARLSEGDAVLIITDRREDRPGRVAKVGRTLYHVTQVGNSWWTGKFRIDTRVENGDGVGWAVRLRTPDERAAELRAVADLAWLRGAGLEFRIGHERWSPDQVRALVESVAAIRGLNHHAAVEGA